MRKEKALSKAEFKLIDFIRKGWVCRKFELQWLGWVTARLP